MIITHLTIRDIHTLCPDDYPAGTHDVVALSATGAHYYSTDYFGSATEAAQFLEVVRTSPVNAADWADSPLPASRCEGVTWVPVAP